MTIGILTVPFNNNYGGFLQAYALKRVLSEMGHEVVFLNRQRDISNYSFKYKVYRLLVSLHIINDFLEERSEKLSLNTNQFKNKYLSPITKPYYTSKEFREIQSLGFDFFIVGSDQVWRYAYAEDGIDDFFFGILDAINTPRISYAASFGTDEMEYPEDKIKTVGKLLNQFSGLSVREESGKALLTNYFNIPSDKVEVVLDPAMLLTVDNYKELFGKYSRPTKKYVFTYILDDGTINEGLIDRFCQSGGLLRMNLKAQTGDTSHLETIAPVEQWLSSIYYSEYVITDSFHGTVFSIIFNKPFLVVANAVRGITRLVDLLTRFGLSNRLVCQIDTSNIDHLNSPIDWSAVNKEMMIQKEKSLLFLDHFLNN